MGITLEVRAEKPEGVFYRYDVDGFKFWFTHHQDGNIYTAGIAAPETKPYLSDVCMYISCLEDANEKDKYYPAEFYLCPGATRMNAREAAEYTKAMSYAISVLEQVEEFFAKKEFLKDDEKS